MQEILNQLAVIILAEGSVRKTKKDTSILFTNTSKTLQNLFKNLVSNLGYRTHRKSNKQEVVYSRQLGEQLLNLSQSYRTKPCNSGGQNACPVTKGKSDIGASCSICKPIRYNGKNFPPASFPNAVTRSKHTAIVRYLKLFCSCEGGVVVGSDVKNDEVIVRVVHPLIRFQLLEMFSKVGIETKVRGNSLVSMKKHSEIKKFKDRIGFVDGVKAVRGNHKGIEKNKLLMFIINRHRPVQTSK